MRVHVRATEIGALHTTRIVEFDTNLAPHTPSNPDWKPDHLMPLQQRCLDELGRLMYPKHWNLNGLTKRLLGCGPVGYTACPREHWVKDWEKFTERSGIQSPSRFMVIDFMTSSSRGYHVWHIELFPLEKSYTVDGTTMDIYTLPQHKY